MGTLLVLLAWGMGAAALPLAQPPGPHMDTGTATEIVRTGTDDQHRMTVPVHIGTHGPFRFMIDTGSQNTVMSTRLAADLALPLAERRTITGIAGQATVDTVAIDDIRLGRRSYDGLVVPLLKAADMDADGIVGLDGLQGQRVVLDFRRHLMAIADARSLGGDTGYEIVITARRRSGQLIVTHARIDGVMTDVVIDTGSDISIGNLALQRAMSARRPTSSTVLTSVTGQEVTAQMTIGAVLTVGDLRIGNLALAYTDAPAFAALGLGRKPALLLGMNELRAFGRVAIDFSRRTVLFDLKAGEG